MGIDNVEALTGDESLPTQQERAQEKYPDHIPEAALANYLAGWEIWDKNGKRRRK